jgi:hypothetical protein
MDTAMIPGFKKEEMISEYENDGAMIYAFENE